MKTFMKILLGCSLAPLVSVPIAVISFAVFFTLEPPGWGMERTWGEIALVLSGVAFWAMVTGYLVMVFLYLPLFLIMRMFGWIGAWQQSISGLICSLGFLLVDTTYGGAQVPHVDIDLFIFLLNFGLCGLSAGWVFWRLAVRGNRAVTRVENSVS